MSKGIIIHDENKIKDILRNIKLGGSVTANLKQYAEYIREKTIDECIGCVPEVKNIGYEKGQEEPNIQDEALADFYDTKAEAFFAGCDETVNKTITNLNNLKNNER